MARRDRVRNIYEDVPDELKDLLKDDSEKGEQPSSRAHRDTLLHNHQWHLNLLAEGAMPPRNLVLPPPYPPSGALSSEMKQTRIADLKIDIRNSKEFVLLRTITDPYVYSSTVTIVEDVFGDAARLTLCNLEDSANDPIVPKDSALLVKQPCWNRLPGQEYHIRVDNPSDCVSLIPGGEAVPKKWRKVQAIDQSKNATTWKKEGDMMFLKKRFRKSLELYNNAQNGISESSDTAGTIDVCRKRCGVNLVLLRFDAAARDLAQAVALHAKHDASLSSSEFTDPSIIEDWLHDRSTNNPLKIASHLPRPLKDLAARIKYDLENNQNTPQYDLQQISSYVGPLTLHVDAANYTSDTEIKQTRHHGRGLFAARAFRSGDLITAEKALALPGYFFNDRSSECSLYSLGDGTATDRAGALLFKELVQKLRHNPSLHKEFFDLDDGGYWKEHGWTVQEGDEVPVDVFRIEHIRRRNCFSAPLRSLDLLTSPAPVRSGFWVHTSYINHNCLPSSVRTFMGDILFLRATRDIAKGEEITTQYLSPELVLKERQERYMGSWGFACDCALCQVDEKVGKRLEGERMVIFKELKGMAQKLGNTPTVTALKKFAKRLRDLEALYDDKTYAELPRLCLVHPTLFLTEAWRGLKNVDKTIESATKLLKYFGIVTSIKAERFEVLRNAGMVNIETTRALRYLAEGYESKRKTDVVEQIRDIARVWFRIITGADVGFEEFMKA